jgi:hypothetical protein
VAKELAGRVPTVFVSVGSPVEIGLVQSLAHPGGNMAGITSAICLGRGFDGVLCSAVARPASRECLGNDSPKL